MRPESYRIFAQLLETYLPESSSAMSMVGSLPGGRKLAQFLHQEMSLSHDQEYQEVDKISWSDLKGSRQGSWVLIKGSTGTGAIKADDDRYESVASTPDSGVQTFTDSRGGNNIDFLKSKIGKLRSFYVGKNLGDVEQKQATRRRQKSVPDGATVTNDTLVERFRPLWLRAMTAAEADVKGMIATMIKNGAYDKAKKKMDYAQRLADAIEKLEVGELRDTPDFLSSAVNLSVLLAASHHYPDKTGNIEAQGYSLRRYTAQLPEGPRQLLKDIASGDQSKLSTVLAFFKRSLVSQ
jgi:hypothetical protein